MHDARKELLNANPPFIALKSGGDGRFHVGLDGVEAILTPKDRKVEFICFSDKILCCVRSAMGYPAFYPMEQVNIQRPLLAVLTDLDGTSVRSEEFWIWVIEQTTAQLLNNPDFRLGKTDLPHVSGHSVSEHLQYCITRYCPEKKVEEARTIYFGIVKNEMRAILQEKGQPNAFQPAPGLANFLQRMRDHRVKIGLVTSGLYEKAWPEIVSAFRTMDLGEPQSVYDAIITAGFPLRDGLPGTLGELEAKPHPWLYAETARVGLGIPFSQRHSVVGIEDSAAGVISIRLAGFAVIGIAGGNIEQSGVRALCHYYCDSLEKAADWLLESNENIPTGTSIVDGTSVLFHLDQPTQQKTQG